MPYDPSPYDIRQSNRKWKAAAAGGLLSLVAGCAAVGPALTSLATAFAQDLLAAVSVNYTPRYALQVEELLVALAAEGSNLPLNPQLADSGYRPPPPDYARQDPRSPGYGGTYQDPYGQQQGTSQDPYAQNQQGTYQDPYGQNQQGAYQEDPYAQNQQGTYQDPYSQDQGPYQDPYSQQQGTYEDPYAQNQQGAYEDPYAQDQQGAYQDLYGQDQQGTYQDPYGQSQQGTYQDPYAQDQQGIDQDPYARPQQGASQDPYAQNRQVAGQPHRHERYAFEGMRTRSASDPISMDAVLVAQKAGREDLVTVEDGQVLRDGRGDPARGDRLKVHFQTDCACYVYVIGIDATGYVANIFPDPDDPGLGNPVQAGSRYVLPRGGDWWGLDDYRGVEQVYFVASHAPRQDLEDAMAKLGNQPRQISSDSYRPVNEPAVVPTRGMVKVSAPRQVDLPTGSDRITVAGFEAAGSNDLVVTRWFRHE